MKAIGWLVALMVLVGACSVSEPGKSATTTTTTTAPVAESTTTISETAPGSAVQAELDWFVGLLNAGDLSEPEYESRFAQVFRDQVSHDAFTQVILDLRRSGPYVVVDRGPNGAVGYAIIENETGTRLRVSGALDDQGRFEGLLVQPEEFPEMANPPESVEAAFDLLDQIGTFRGIAAEISDGTCSPIASVGADEPLPLGSVFKLYVLGTLALQVDAGAIAWDEELVITDDVKSIPTGVLQDRESGTTVTLRRASELMISISDNTAADLIARRLGREVIEGSLAELGMADPELNIPFLTTLEFAVLKLHADEATRQAFVEGDVAARRAILAELAGVGVDQLDITGFIEPIEPDHLEWFATPADLCRLAIRLTALSRHPGLEPIGEILGVNPGVPDDDARWASIWFKGGSEPGLLTIWWTLEDEDGRRFVLTGSNVDDRDQIQADDAILVWSATRDVLAVQAER